MIRILRNIKLLNLYEDELSDSLLSSSVGLIGDIAMAFGDYIGPQLINYCSSENIQVKYRKYYIYF